MPAPAKTTVELDGSLVTMFHIAFLAQQLERTSATVRRWQRVGIVPPPIFKIQNGYRIYTLEEIEAYKRVFVAERVRNGLSFKRTNFAARLMVEVSAIRERYARLVDSV